MLTVHHLNDSRSQRILWLLEELEVPYEIKHYQRLSTARAPKELRDIHPLGKSPIITDGDVTLAESGAIIEYIIDKYGNGAWKAKTEKGQVVDLYYSHYAEGTVMPPLVNTRIFELAPEYAPWLLRPVARSIFSSVKQQIIDPEIKANSKMIEKHLEQNTWFAGEDQPTRADALMIFVCEVLLLRGEKPGPKTAEYVKRITARPAYQRALQKGGRYRYAAKL